MADLVTHNYTGSPAAGRGLVVLCGRSMEDRGAVLRAMASVPPVEHHRDQTSTFTTPKDLAMHGGRIVA